MRRALVAAAGLCVMQAAAGGAGALGAQSLAARVTATDGPVQVVYPSRPRVCGDGSTFIANVRSSGDYHTGRPCIHGPARVVVTVLDGRPTRLRAYVGPVPESGTRTIPATDAEAAAWLEQLVARGETRVARDAMLPLVLADSTDPWPALLRAARDERRPESLRRNALLWLGAGVDEHLGIADTRADTDDDELRKQAVFVISQHPGRDGTAALMDAARASKRPAVRRDAIFWLGQTADIPVVARLYEELLKEP